MRVLLLLSVSAGLLPSAIIHGIILENISSRPLSRTRVRLQRITGEGVMPYAQAITNRAGQYWFPSLPDGKYMVTAVRTGFADTAYGQKKVGLPGLTLTMEGDGVVFAEIKMRHLGAIAGKVVDENSVGMPGVGVIAYPTTLPLRMASSGKTDDRGSFRLGMLTPGNYWIRTGPLELDDGSGILPTFYPLSTNTKEAKLVRADLDVETTDIYIQPLPGRLFTLSGTVRCVGEAPPDRVRVTLSADTGRKEAVTNCINGSYKFDQLAPGSYEVLGEPMNGDASMAAWFKRDLDRDSGSGDLVLTSPPRVAVSLDGESGARVPPDAARVVYRRRDPAGETHTMTSANRLLPGNWEIFVYPQPAFAFTRYMAQQRIDRSSTNENAPFFEFDQADRAAISLRFSNQPGSVEGVVRRAGEVVPGAPYFLLAVSPTVRRLTHGVRNGLTDDNGKFKATGLPPGDYLLLSSFDLEEVNQTILEDSRAVSVQVKEGNTQSVTLELFVR